MSDASVGSFPTTTAASIATPKSGATKKTWKSSSHAQELERVDRLLKDYEKANLELKEEIVRLHDVEAIHIKRLQDMDKQQKQLLKKIKSLETSLKFEKVAGDGLRKRGNTFEASVLEFQEKASNALQQLDYYQSKNEELEETLQHERSTRLQLLHEKSKILLQSQEISKRNADQEKELVNCHQKITEHIQRIETLEERVAQQEEIMKYQSKEFVQVSHEIIRVKEELLQTKEKLLSEYEEKHNFHFSVDLLQKEISYLRKELIANAESHSQRSYSSFQPSHPSQYQTVTRHVNQYTASRFETSSFTKDRAFTSKHKEDEALLTDGLSSDSKKHQQQKQGKKTPLMLSDSVVTPFNLENPATTAPLTATTTSSHHHQSDSTHNDSRVVSRLSTADRPRGALDYLEVTNKGSVNFDNPERREMLQWIRNSGKELAQKHFHRHQTTNSTSPLLQSSIRQIQQQYGSPHNKKKKQRKKKKHSEEEASEEEEEEEGEESSFVQRRELERKSLWVGSGLNYRQDDETDRKLKELQAGSTKQILRRILETID